MASSSRATPPRDRGVRDHGQAFLRDVVDHIEDPEATLPSLALSHRQAFLATEPLGLLAVHQMAFGAQQDMQTAIAEPTLLGRQLSHRAWPRS